MVAGARCKVKLKGVAVVFSIPIGSLLDTIQDQSGVADGEICVVLQGRDVATTFACAPGTVPPDRLFGV